MKYCVDKEMAMQVVSYFYENKNFDKTLEWEFL